MTRCWIFKFSWCQDSSGPDLTDNIHAQCSRAVKTDGVCRPNMGAYKAGWLLRVCKTAWGASSFGEEGLNRVFLGIGWAPGYLLSKQPSPVLQTGIPCLFRPLPTLRHCCVCTRCSVNAARVGFYYFNCQGKFPGVSSSTSLPKPHLRSCNAQYKNKN